LLSGEVNHIHSKYINIYIINVNKSMYRYSNYSMHMCRMQRFLAFRRSFFHFPLLRSLSFHHFPPTSFLSSLTSSCHLFLGLLLSLVVSKFIYNTFFLGGGGGEILFSSILCTSQNQRNLFNLIVSVIVIFKPLYKFLYWLIFSNFLFHCHYWA